MTAFQPVRLDDCCHIISGATPKTGTKAYWDGDIFWATPKDLSTLEGPYIDRTPRSITHAGLQSCSATVLPERSVLFSSRAPIGHVAINRVPMATNQGFKSLVPKAGRVHPEYLFHWLRSNRSYLESLGNGATFKEVSKAVVSRVEIPLPPLPEQRRIADILDKAEALRAQRRTALTKLDTLTQSIFIDLFGDPVTNPLRWPLASADHLCERITVGIVVQPSSHYQESGVPALRSLNIRPNEIVMENFVYFSASDNEEKLAKTRVRTGDVLLVRSGLPGTAAVVPSELDGVNAIDILIATPNIAKVDPLYLCYYFNSDGGKRMALGARRGQVQKHLNVGSLKEAPIPLPPLRLQQDFARRIKNVEALKFRHRKALAELDSLFASLQHRAFSGTL